MLRINTALRLIHILRLACDLSWLFQIASNFSYEIILRERLKWLWIKQKIQILRPIHRYAELKDRQRDCRSPWNSKFYRFCVGHVLPVFDPR